jgi:hypothetical protein
MFVKDHEKGQTFTTRGGRSSDKTCSAAAVSNVHLKHFAVELALGNQQPL